MPVIAVSTYSFGPEAVARDVLEFALRHGIRGLELGSWKLWQENLSPEERHNLRRAVAQEGLRLSIHFIHRGVALAAHDPERRKMHLDQLLGTIRLLRDLGGEVVVLHLGQVAHPTVPPPQASEETRREALLLGIDTLKRAARVAEEEGITLCVENELQRPGDVVRSYRELLEVVRAVGSPAVGVTLDTGHAARTEGLEPALKLFGPLIRHIHIHDSQGGEDHLELGRGALDFRPLAPFLRGFPHILTMECQDTGDPEGAVLRSRDWLEALLKT